MCQDIRIKFIFENLVFNSFKLILKKGKAKCLLRRRSPRSSRLRYRITYGTVLRYGTLLYGTGIPAYDTVKITELRDSNSIHPVSLINARGPSAPSGGLRVY